MRPPWSDDNVCPLQCDESSATTTAGKQQPHRVLLSPQISLYVTRERFKIQAADAQENNNSSPRCVSVASSLSSSGVFLFIYLPNSISMTRKRKHPRRSIGASLCCALFRVSRSKHNLEESAPTKTPLNIFFEFQYTIFSSVPCFFCYFYIFTCVFGIFYYPIIIEKRYKLTQEVFS